jgi:SOS-response transcriptional repressor LexA
MSLTDRVFQFICEYSDDNRGLTPTVREIAAGLGLRSHGPVSVALEALQEKDFIRRHRFGDQCKNNIEIVFEDRPKGERVGFGLRDTAFPQTAALTALFSIDAVKRVAA